MSDILKKAAESYAQICRKRYRFEFSNGCHAVLCFRPQNFVHLAGLRKLGDLYEFQQERSAVTIYKDILRGGITDLDAQRSIHYDTDARARIERLSDLESLLHTKTAVWDFDPKICRARTALKSRIILFRAEERDFYLILGIAPDGKTYYPETFFLRYDDAYIHGQQIVGILSFAEEAEI